MLDIPGRYTALIRAIGDGTGLADSLLHVHAGMAILLFTRVVTGRSLSHPLPLCVVAVAEAANEVLDRLHYGSWRWNDTSMDILNTLFWPTVIYLGLHFRPLRQAKIKILTTRPFTFLVRPEQANPPQ